MASPLALDVSRSNAVSFCSTLESIISVNDNLGKFKFLLWRRVPRSSREDESNNIPHLKWHTSVCIWKKCWTLILHAVIEHVKPFQVRNSIWFIFSAITCRKTCWKLRQNRKVHDCRGVGWYGRRMVLDRAMRRWRSILSRGKKHVHDSSSLWMWQLRVLNSFFSVLPASFDGFWEHRAASLCVIVFGCSYYSKIVDYELGILAQCFIINLVLASR